MSDGGNAPSWLFSFVDLAFLLLIAMTQIGGDGSDMAVELGEIVVPRVHEGTAAELPAEATARWQLRVHAAGDGSPPFELVQSEPPGGEGPGGEEARLGAEALSARLAALHKDGIEKPLLAPHGESHSQDLLLAASALEEFWPRRRRATVAPVFAWQ